MASVQASQCPYSPEYADLETNTTLLEKLRALTDGESYADSDDASREAAAGGDVFRSAPAFSRNLQPVWHWLLFATAVLLFFDVASRRIALEFGVVVAAAVAAWDRLARPQRCRRPRVLEFIDRLKARKARRSRRGHRPGKEDAAFRCRRRAANGGAPPPGRRTRRSLRLGVNRAAAPQRPKPTAGQEGGDYLSRLKKAKKTRRGGSRSAEKDDGVTGKMLPRVAARGLVGVLSTKGIRFMSSAASMQ